MSSSARRIVCAFAAVGLLMLSPQRSAADEHSSHHGGGASGGMGGEMGGGMGGEMEGEHGRARTPFYPSLMNLPELNADQRAQLDQAAQLRMSDGARLMSRRVDLLSNPEDAASMREGTAQIREGLDQFQSGLAAREALQQGTPAQTVAFKWFRQQLNLSIPGEEAEAAHSPWPFTVPPLFHGFPDRHRQRRNLDLLPQDAPCAGAHAELGSGRRPAHGRNSATTPAISRRRPRLVY